MIFEFLDAKKKRIATSTTENLVYDNIGRERKDNRFIGDSVELEFTIDLLPIIKRSKYVLLSDTGIFRVNPLLKITELDYSDTVTIVGKSSDLEQANEIKLSWDGIVEGNTETETVIEEVGYDTAYIADETLYEGDTHVLVQGQPGIVERVYEVTYENGVEVGRLLIGENYIQEPVEEVIVHGTKSVETKETITVTEEVPYETIYHENKDLEPWEEIVRNEGEDGLVERTYEITYRYEEEVKRELVGENYVKHPTNRDIEVGVESEYTTEIEEVIEEIWHDTEWVGNPEKPVWEEEITIQEGQDGEAIATYKVTYINGYEEGRELIHYEVLKEPKNQIYEYGTNPNSRIEWYVREEKDIPYETEQREVEGLPKGFTYLLQEGEVGKDITYYNIYYLDEVEVDRVESGGAGLPDYSYPPVKGVFVEGVTEYEEDVEVRIEVIPSTVEKLPDEYMDIGEEYTATEGTEGVTGYVYKNVYDESGNIDSVETVNTVKLVEQTPTVIYYGTSTTRYDWVYETIEEDYEIEYIDDPYLPLGEQIVYQEGIKGLKDVDWEIEEEYIEGVWVEVNREVLNEYIRVERRDKIVHVGTGELVNEAMTLNLTSVEPVALDTSSYLTGKVRRLNQNTSTGLFTFINQELSKIGYELELITKMREEEVTREVVKYLETEFTIMELIEAVLQVIDGIAEFDTVIVDDYVAKTKIRLGDNLGKEFGGELRYKENITSIKVDERREGVITAIEYTGMEINKETGEVLTLNWGGKNVRRDYMLPNSKRPVRLEVYEKRDGTKQYVLEDKDATSIYGNDTNVVGREVVPKIKVMSNGNITNIQDLIEESIKELDGKSLPRTRYNITAVVKGIDVGDYVSVNLPHLGINMSMPVLSVNYEIGNPEVVYITVGEYLPTEIDRIYEELPKTGGEGGGKETNYYDRNGNRYEPGHYDGNGNWVDGGYWDDKGNFNSGYHDSQGNWLDRGDEEVKYFRNIPMEGFGWELDAFKDETRLGVKRKVFAYPRHKTEEVVLDNREVVELVGMFGGRTERPIGLKMTATHTDGFEVDGKIVKSPYRINLSAVEVDASVFSNEYRVRLSVHRGNSLLGSIVVRIEDGFAYKTNEGIYHRHLYTSSGKSLSLDTGLNHIREIKYRTPESQITDIRDIDYTELEEWEPNPIRFREVRQNTGTNVNPYRPTELEEVEGISDEGDGSGGGGGGGSR